MNIVRPLVAALTLAIVAIVLAPAFTDGKWRLHLELMTK